MARPSLLTQRGPLAKGSRKCPLRQGQSSAAPQMLAQTMGLLRQRLSPARTPTSPRRQSGATSELPNLPWICSGKPWEAQGASATCHVTISVRLRAASRQSSMES